LLFHLWFQRARQPGCGRHDVQLLLRIVVVVVEASLVGDLAGHLFAGEFLEEIACAIGLCYVSHSRDIDGLPRWGGGKGVGEWRGWNAETYNLLIHIPVTSELLTLRAAELALHRLEALVEVVFVSGVALAVVHGSGWFGWVMFDWRWCLT
jgi:hypothetical protein